MSLPYSTPPHAWRFVLILHKLASLDNQPLRITPAGKSSIYTARAKLFQGRSYILSTHDPALARYSPLANQACIHTLDSRLEISKSEHFDAAYSNLFPDTFTNIYRAIVAELQKFTKSFGFPYGPDVYLTSAQCKALKDFLTNIHGVKYVNVNNNSVLVSR